VQKVPLPHVFEPDFYRGNYPDLAGLTDRNALEHYRVEGIANGYAASPASERGHLLSFARAEGSILEIGPFHAPSVVGDNVRYMDVLTSEELLEAVRVAGHDTSNVPVIHYVAPRGGFDMVGRKFSAVFSGHCIEHQPDLIRHFQGVSSVLEDDGRYYIACPDRRYCFDHFIPETAVVDVLAAYHQTRKVHQPRSFIAQRLHRAHNDAARHWSGDHGAQPYESYQDAKREIFDGLPDDDTYHDAHAWQFTPSAFFGIMTFLREVGLTDLVVERVYHTRFGSQEFTAVLRKGEHAIEKDEAFIESTPLKEHISILKKGQSHSEIEIATLRNAYSRSEAEVAILKKENSHAESELSRLRSELAKVYSSRSWTATRLLRTIASHLGMSRT
jgi:SAM-dependent methyltransferase